MSKKSAGIKQARVLCAFTFNGVEYKPDQIIEADQSVLGQLIGNVDPSPDAVQYVLDNSATIIRA
ncbi:hypothetical protein [Nitrosomonas communis]|uniref:Uncharacterized protein n=1 Tax=Nitrosomonas communis TaxID=44574 RepID=A0A1I4UUY2_9PROT|nr:hypothetical protein [Nitrosomonas communis]SFM92695.1 hypothetical protein SAMN05421863_10716 [Nitrosomonas communis]